MLSYAPLIVMEFLVAPDFFRTDSLQKKQTPDQTSAARKPDGFIERLYLLIPWVQITIQIKFQIVKLIFEFISNRYSKQKEYDIFKIKTF